MIIRWRAYFFAMSTVISSIISLLAASSSHPTTRPLADPPAVGDTAPDFSFTTLDGRSISLSESLRDGPVLLVILRGWVGDQDPTSTRQLRDLLVRARDLSDSDSRVILIYPGPPDQLAAHVSAFIGGFHLPDGFVVALDPGYVFSRTWHLRWDAAGETVYPASFVISKDAIIRFAKISRSHGGRASAGELVEAVKAAR